MVSEGSSRSDMYVEYLGPMDVNLVCSHTLVASTKLFLPQGLYTCCFLCQKCSSHESLDDKGPP